jgi:hypothetical protein
MGIHDSSKTRVEPVFDGLVKADPTIWLPRLLALPMAGNSVPISPNFSYSITNCRWGNNEQKLAPPVSLLSWLIRHPRKPTSGKLSEDPAKAVKRQEWIDGSNDRIAEGLGLLRSNPTQEDWHIFEGETQPDVFIETKNLIVIIEGKRTERSPTTKTKWMHGRHQMLRHIDCAWEMRGNKAVVGFFIVEGLAKSEEVPSEWMAFAKETMSESAITSSLPHRGPAEQSEIASAFAGVTTWQRLCREFRGLGVIWENLPDTCELKQ